MALFGNKGLNLMMPSSGRNMMSYSLLSAGWWTKKGQFIEDETEWSDVSLTVGE